MDPRMPVRRTLWLWATRVFAVVYLVALIGLLWLGWPWIGAFLGWLTGGETRARETRIMDVVLGTVLWTLEVVWVFAVIYWVIWGHLKVFWWLVEVFEEWRERRRFRRYYRSLKSEEDRRLALFDEECSARAERMWKRFYNLEPEHLTRGELEALKDKLTWYITEHRYITQDLPAVSPGADPK